MLSPYQAACCPPEPIVLSVPQGTPVRVNYYPWQRPTSQQEIIKDLMGPKPSAAPPRPDWLPPYCTWRVPKEGEYYYVPAPHKSSIRRAGSMYIHPWWVVVPPDRPSCVPIYAVWKTPLPEEEYHCFKQPQRTTTSRYTTPLGGCFRWTIVPPPMPASVEAYTKRNGLRALWRRPGPKDVYWDHWADRWRVSSGCIVPHHWVLTTEGWDPLAYQDLSPTDSEV